MAATEEGKALVGAWREGEACWGDAVRGAQSRGEDVYGSVKKSVVAEVGKEESKQGRDLMVGAESTVEVGVGDDAVPELADEGGAWEGGGERREAQEDLPENVFVVRQGLRRRQRRGRGRTLAHLDGPWDGKISQ